MALVEVDPVHDSLDGLVERGVVEDDVRGLAAELERQLLARACELALDRLADLRRAREGDLVDVGVLDQLGACASVARDDVDDAGRQLGLAEHIGEEQGRERRRLGGLEDDRVSGGQRGRDLPREHEQREVPRDDLAGNSYRTRAAMREGVLELVGPAGVVEEVCGCQRKVDVAGLLDRLSAVQRLQHRELARALLQDARDPKEILRPLRRRDRRPAVVVGVTGCLHGQIDVLGTSLPNLREHLLGRRADGRKVLARLRLDELTADVEAVALLERDDVARFRSRCVVPAGGNRRAILSAFEVSHRGRPRPA